MWSRTGRVCLSKMNGYNCSLTGKLLVTRPAGASSPTLNQASGGRHLATGDSNKAYGKVHDFISSKKKDDDDGKDSTTSRDAPRMIIVKRGDLTNPTANTAHVQPTVGKLKPRFPLERQIRDSQGKTIWIPASKASDYYPTVRANALLDSTTYVRAGGDSIAGTEAARRLLHGKKDLIVLLRYVQRPVLLQGHGIPSQVLDHLLHSAVLLMDSTNAVNDLRWEQTNDGTHGDKVLAEWCVENLKKIYVDGTEATMSELYQELAEDLLLLYWTVMDRIIKRLCFKRVPSMWNVEFRRKASSSKVSLILDYKRTDASVMLKGNQAELVFQTLF